MSHKSVQTQRRGRGWGTELHQRVSIRKCALLETVLVGSGYYDEIPWTESLNNTHLFIMVLEAGSVSSGCQQGWVFDGALLPGYNLTQTFFLALREF